MSLRSSGRGLRWATIGRNLAREKKAMKKKKSIAVPREDRAMTDAADSEVAKRAYSLWENDGRPEGADLEYWLRAEQELRQEGGSLNPSDEGAK